MDNIPRHKPENPYGYTNVELAQRKKALHDMQEMYPAFPYQWLEMVYDFDKHTDPEEVKRIINTGEWEIPGNFSKRIIEK